MIYTVSITSQGQITIPAALRKELALNKNKQALISKKDDKLIIEPVIDFLELGGSLAKYAKGKKPLTDEEMDEAVAQGFVDDYKSSL